MTAEERIERLLFDLYGCQVSEGTLATWVEFAAERLTLTVAQIADWVSAASLQHADETGMRVAGKRYWLHVNSTRFLRNGGSGVSVPCLPIRSSLSTMRLPRAYHASCPCTPSSAYCLGTLRRSSR